MIANEFDIQSIRQLLLFVQCAGNEGKALSEIIEVSPATKEYKSYYTQALKLMAGSKNRNYDGLNLLVRSTGGKTQEKAIYLTKRGKLAYDRIRAELDGGYCQT